MPQHNGRTARERIDNRDPLRRQNSIFCERGVGRDASATNEAAVPTGNVGRSVLRSRSARAWARTHLEMVD